MYYFAKKCMYKYKVLYFTPDINKLSGEIHALLAYLVCQGKATSSLIK
jgi:hypothetical protein